MEDKNYDEQVREFIRTKGVTKCPTVVSEPIQETLHTDADMLRRHAAGIRRKGRSTPAGRCRGTARGGSTRSHRAREFDAALRPIMRAAIAACGDNGAIAAYLNRSGQRTLSGKEWTPHNVYASRKRLGL